MKEINIRDVKESPVELINDGWGLLSAGNKNGWNTMTVSWGAIGELWNKDVAIVFVRPQRYTKEFMDSSEYFTLCFFDKEYKKALQLCGVKSGRDTDKAKETGLTPVFCCDTVYLEQAKLVFVCRKIACQDMDSKGFIDKTIENNYKSGDYHTTYVGEIVKILEK